MANLPINSNTDPYYYFYSGVIRTHREYDLNQTQTQNQNQNQNLIDELLDLCNQIEYNDSLEIKECPITLEKFKEKDKIIELPCKHYFSKNAIITWFKEKLSNPICPLCRYKLIEVPPKPKLSIGEQIDSIISHLSEFMLQESTINDGEILY